MKIYSNKKRRRNNKKKEKKACGLTDYIVDKLPEIHIPGYQYCGPGTNLEKRLARGDPGVNKLDQACKTHDIAYSKFKNSKDRYKADKTLVTQALPRIYSKDAKLGERAAALLVSGVIGTKMGLSKVGLGFKKNKRTTRKKTKNSQRRRRGKAKHRKNVKKTAKRRKNKRKKVKSIAFSKLLHGARTAIKNSKFAPSKMRDTINAAIWNVKDMKRGKTVKMSRVLKVPKFGGSILPILPILSALSAIGSISSSAAGVVKAIKSIQNAEKHNKSEVKIGRNLYLTRNVKGSGFYLRPFHRR